MVGFIPRLPAYTLPAFAATPIANTQFQNLVQSFQEKINAALPPGSTPQQINDFIQSVGNGDAKLTAQELSAALGIPLALSEQIISLFNTKGDTDKALDATELKNALEFVNSITNPQQNNPTGGKSPGETGGLPESNQSDLYQLLLKLLDKNGDKQISIKDVEQFVSQLNQYAGSDGKFTKTELAQAIQAEAEKLGLDFSSDEIEQIVEQVFAQLGPNQDGPIDSPTLMAALNRTVVAESSGASLGA